MTVPSSELSASSHPASTRPAIDRVAVMQQVARELMITNDLMSSHAKDLSQGIGILTRLVTQQLSLASAQQEEETSDELSQYDAKENGRQAMQALQSLMMAMQFEDLMSQRLSQLSLILEKTAETATPLRPDQIHLQELRDTFDFILQGPPTGSSG